MEGIARGLIGIADAPTGIAEEVADIMTEVGIVTARAINSTIFMPIIKSKVESVIKLLLSIFYL